MKKLIAYIGQTESGYIRDRNILLIKLLKIGLTPTQIINIKRDSFNRSNLFVSMPRTKKRRKVLISNSIYNLLNTLCINTSLKTNYLFLDMSNHNSNLPPIQLHRQGVHFIVESLCKKVYNKKLKPSEIKEL